MRIFPENVAKEVRVDANHPLVTLLTGSLGVTKPKIILVVDSNEKETGNDPNKQPRWKVHVFYNSPADLKHADLSVTEVPAKLKIKPTGDEVIKTIYPEEYIGWCGVVNGQAIWTT